MVEVRNSLQSQRQARHIQDYHAWHAGHAPADVHYLHDAAILAD